MTRPDNAVEEIELHDDGRSGGNRAGDGIFAARISWVIPGSCLARVSGEGESPVAGAFRIPQILGYLKRDGTDRDRDGLPDAWERMDSTMPPSSRGARSPRSPIATARG